MFGWLALTIAAFLVLLLGVAVIPRLLYPPLSTADLKGVTAGERRVELQQAQSQLENNARAMVLQGVGGILVAAGVVATWRQLLISRDAQITERFTRAVDQTGSEKLNVRLGGIYALERIAKNSQADRTVISELLTAFVRVHAPWTAREANGSAPEPLPSVDQLAWLSDRAPDVQAAMHVLGRRPAAHGEVRLQLSRVDLRRSYLSRSRLVSANIRHSSLAGAWLRYTRLDDGDLVNTDLRQANLEGASLAEAKLRDAHLDEANLRGARLMNADLVRAKLRGADLREADLRHADLRGADLVDTDLDRADLAGVRHDAATSWPAGFDAVRLSGATTSDKEG